MLSTWKLLIEDDAGKTIVVPLARDVITIGRKEGNTIRLTERNVSRFHAKLMREPASVFIEDLGSYNGIKLNGDRIKGRVEIQEGDLIEIGDYHLALQNEGALSQPTQPAMEATAKLQTGAPLPSPLSAPVSDDDLEDDQFAGDTQRWEPPSSMEPVPVGPTMSDQAPFSAGLPTDLPTMDDTVPLPPAEAMPAPVSPQEFDATVRNPSAPNLPAPGVGQTEPFAPSPSGSDEASGDFLPAPALKNSSKSSGLVSHTDLTEPLAPASPLPPIEAPPSPSVPGNGVAPSVLTEPVKVGAGLPLELGLPGEKGVADAPKGFPPKGPDPDETMAVERASGGEQAHRLIAINTVFAGSVFPLRREEIIIGRVEENDLVIEHRSVSRSHAKLVRDGDAYQIVDLKSANGVLLNGADVGQARLKSGDVIELGRVRLRFVPAGETFSLSDDDIQKARVADTHGDDFNEETQTALRDRLDPGKPATGKNPNTLLIAAFGAIIVLLLLVIVILLTRDGGDDGVEAAVDAPQVAVTGDMSDEVKEAIGRENEGQLKEAEALWKDLKADGNIKADAALQRIEAKLADRSRFKEINASVKDEDWNNVLEVAKGFSEHSVYGPQVAVAVATAAEGKIASTTSRIDRALKGNDLSEATSALATLKAQDKKRTRYREYDAKLKAARKAAANGAGTVAPVRSAAARNSSSTKGSPARSGSASKTSPSKTSPSKTKATNRKPAQKAATEKAAPARNPKLARAELDKASKALVFSQWDKALMHAQSAKRADANNNDSNRVLGTIYKNQGRHKRAAKAYREYLKRGGSAQRNVIKKYLAQHPG